MNMKKILFTLLCILSFSFVYAVGLDTEGSKVSAENDIDAGDFSPSVQIALSNNAYRVTAGDVYSLTYAAGSSSVSYTIPVDPSYKIRVSNLAVLDASGKTYIQLKKEVEEIVLKNYPMSGVQFVLMNPATFKVTVKGEVKQTTERSAWALTRLSSVIKGLNTPYSSLRDITVISTNGRKNTYDLFKSSRDGDLSQNPYIRPGDTIIINRINRVVTISGAVERPGSYELMKNENLAELIKYYGNGLTELADTSRIELVRNRDNLESGGEKSYLTQKDLDSNYQLINGDRVYIRSVKDHLPYIVIEGIINQSDEGMSDILNDQTPVDTMRRRTVKFYEGENYASLIRRYKNIFNSYSDLVNAYIERGNSKIVLNLEEIIENELFVSPYNVEKNDKLVVPFQQHFVTLVVSGEVTSVHEENAWPLRRLSTIIGDNLTEFSSRRNVKVTSVDGVETYYDLFKASRDGDLSQNPYIKAGETITVQRMERKVSISGAVERPGTYELVEGEGLKDLIEYYGNGLGELADTSRIELVRSRDNLDIGGEKSYLTQTDLDANYPLMNRDSVTVRSMKDHLPYIVIEGIINQNDEAVSDQIGDINPKDMIRHRTVKFYDGENYASLIRRYQGVFNSYSDLQNCYIERNGKKISINLEEIIEDILFISPYDVEKNDKLVVPYQQHFVTVLVSGEVTSVHEENAWPLRRLSTIISDNLTDYSSIRNVLVTSIDGVSKEYDIYKFRREGDLSQNPYVRAGETITVQRISRKVTISGAVERPGTYELLENENLSSLINRYGNGLETMADLSRVEITRKLDTEDKSGKKIYLSEDEVSSDYKLLCYDSIYIPSYASLKPVIFVEGAVGNIEEEGTKLESNDKIAVRFENGTDLSAFVRSHSKYFGSISDIENAYIIREGKIIPMDLSPMLYDKTYYSKFILQNNDTLMIPFKQYFVSVAGAVNDPGRYPYIPDRTYEYYVGLAGGFIKEKNSFDSVDIIDVNGKKHKKSEVITPETTITADYNSALYKFNQYSSVILTALSILTTALSAYAVVSSTINK